MKKVLNLLNNLLSVVYAHLSGTEHIWQYEPDKRHISITNKCRQQIKELGLSESYAFDVYTNGLKSGDNFMVKKYHGYQVSILYMIAPDTGRVVLTWIGKKEIR